MQLEWIEKQKLSHLGSPKLSGSRNQKGVSWGSWRIRWKRSIGGLRPSYYLVSSFSA